MMGDMRQRREESQGKGGNGKSVTPVGDSEGNSGKLCKMHALEFSQSRSEGTGVFIPIYLVVVG